ncbi:MAG: hypothetical protein WBG50_23455 [Desulfomonilaceae bacterium]
MTRVFVLLALALFFLTGTPILSETLPGPCGDEQAKWSSAYESLRAGMESYRKVKYESIGPQITQEIGKRESRKPIARIVRAALKERSERLAEAGERCRELADQEQYCFKDLQRCAAIGGRRRGNSSIANFTSISRERIRLIAELKELLLDEAYIQYRNHRAPATPASPSYEANQPSNIRFR